MTSASIPSGIASASTEYNATYLAYRAMDKSNSTFWRTTAVGKAPCNLNYQFILSQVIDKYTITSSTTTNCAPKDWKFQGRNAGTWTDLDTQSSITGWGSNETKSYTFTNTTAYAEYRILVSANNGGTYTEIAEIEMMATITGAAKVSSVDLQTEITATQAKVSSLNLDVEAFIPYAKVSSLNLQVEVIEGVAPTSRLKKYIDGAWTVFPLKQYGGASWEEHPLKYYDGDSWEQ